MWSRIRSWVRGVMRRSRMESEMDAELKFHIEAFAEDLVRSGVSHQEALRRACIEFGGIERAKEECRESRGRELRRQSHTGFALRPPHAAQIPWIYCCRGGDTSEQVAAPQTVLHRGQGR